MCQAVGGFKISVFYKKMPELSQLVGFYESSTIRTDEIRNLIHGRGLDKAFFVYYHGLENNWLFQTILRKKFKRSGFKYSGNLKENIVRIEQKIKEDNDNMGKLTDMVRGTVLVRSPDEMNIAYNMIKDTQYIDIVRIKNKLFKPPYNTIFLNVIFKDNIVGEIQIRFG